ncbi:MAG: hypothetical protein HC794_09225 [Nitrospiraceae bacterium]|nr:hypothetical protein [Nitrospiraceae bacterium]
MKILIADGIDTGSQGSSLHVGMKLLIGSAYLRDLADKTRRGQEFRRWKSELEALGYVVEHRARRVTKDQLFSRILRAIDESEGKLAMASATFHLVEAAPLKVSLEPGDVIATGTPGGVGIAMKPPRLLQLGDVVRVEVAGLGTLENTVVDEPATTAAPLNEEDRHVASLPALDHVRLRLRVPQHGGRQGRHRLRRQRHERHSLAHRGLPHRERLRRRHRPGQHVVHLRLDAARRDFTINALAIQVSPMASQWRIQDLFGGLDDLERRLIRVLHSLSFVDDPTRILRAVRFSQRLHFPIETRTAELIHTALPMLNHITGERLRHELTLLLQEADPERGMMHLQQLGALTAIHPSLHFSAALSETFHHLRTTYAALPLEDRTMLLWYAWLTMLDSIEDVMERLLFAGQRTQAVIAAAHILRDIETLTAPQTPISRVVFALERLPGESLTMLLYLLPPDQRAILEGRYAYRLSRVPHADGNTLRRRGVPPGPIYKRTLDRLRMAWLDGEISTPKDEEALLGRLLKL